MRCVCVRVRACVRECVRACLLSKVQPQAPMVTLVGVAESAYALLQEFNSHLLLVLVFLTGALVTLIFSIGLFCVALYARARERE